MASSLGIAPLLKPVESLDKKWLDRDPLNAVHEDCVSDWYNELLSEKEIYIRPESFLNRHGIASHQSSNGHFYCGQAVIGCQCCNGVCGPEHGCNCTSCQEIEEEVKENKDAKNVHSPYDHIEAWAWGKLPSSEELKNFTKLVAHQQLVLFKSSADSLLFIQRLKARIYVYARFLSAYSKTCFLPSTKDMKASEPLKSPNIARNVNAANLVVTESDFVRSGLNMLLKYTFKFMEKTWESGQNLELCTEMLQEAVHMFENLPKVLLFNDTEHSEDLVLMLKKSIVFLEKIITINNRDSYLAISDRKTALYLLFELVFQRASLDGILHVINVCLELSESGILEYIRLDSFLRKLLNQSSHMDFDPEILTAYFSQLCHNDALGDSQKSDVEFVDEEEKMTKVMIKLMKILVSMMKPYQIEEQKKSEQCCEDILVWGNLKLLSSLKQEKVEFKIATICCTEIYVVVLTLNGKVLWCEHDNEAMNLQPYKQLANIDVIQIACTYDGHFIVLSKQKEIFTWQDNGSFDFFSTVPLQLEFSVAKIYAGFGYYAVLSTKSELCIWDSTLIGRTTHGSHNMQFHPRRFSEIKSEDVLDISFSQYHTEVILVTVGGQLWSWQNEKLTLLSNEELDIVKVYIAKYFYVALSSTGQVYRWGRDRFCKAQSDDLVCLQSVEKLNKQNVLAISVGAYHCVALTDSYNVFCWGGLGGKEEEESLIREPVLLKAVSEIGVSHITAGPHQIFCWCATFSKKVEKKVPFCIDVKQETFEALEILLQKSQTTRDEKLKHALLVSCLPLLKLQFRAAKMFDVSPQEIGFSGEEKFSIRLKELVINLVLQQPRSSALRKICEQVLESGWSYLLPTAEERARTLTEFLKVTTETYNESHAFVINLLLNCLMQKDGLESILEETLDKMMALKKEGDLPSSTLYVLLKELFLANVISVFSTLDNNQSKIIGNIGRDILNLLLKFQRLLFARIFVVSEKDVCWPARCYVYEPTPIIKCLTSIVSFYMALLQSSCKQILTCRLQNIKKKEILLFSPIGILFREFIHFMIMLQNYAPVITSNCDGLSQLAEILDLYSVFNQVIACNVGKSDMDWPLQPGECPVHDSDSEKEEEVESLNDEDICNSIKEEKQLVKDVPTVGDSLDAFVGKEVSSAFAEVFISEEGKIAMKRALVAETNKVPIYTDHNFKQVTYDNEIAISFLLGLHCCYLAHGTYPSQDEVNNKKWLQSRLFSAGIDRDTVLRDLKRVQLPSLSVDDLMKEELSQSASSFIDYVYIQAKRKGVQIIPSTENHVLDCVTRMILAVMIWHSGLEKELSVIQQYLFESETSKHAMESSDIMTDALFLAVKMALKERTFVFQKHQETGATYDALCAPIFRKCRFLHSCLHPSCHPKQYKKKMNKWFNVISAIKMKYGYSWNLSNWGFKLHNHKKNFAYRKDVMKEVGEFVADKNINIDIMRKCFLTQIKRAKQRLISGYLMQSLCLRQHLKQSVSSSLLMGWLGLLVPGGSVSHSKPGILFNVELVPQDDIIKLQEVFKGFENFSLKIIFDELEKIYCATCHKTEDVKKQICTSSRALLLASTVLTSSLMSGDVDFLLQCDVLDKIQTILKYCGEINNNMKSIPFIDERKHKQAHLLEMNGVEMIKLMKIGTRVGRGTDWKWDDQDGPPPSQGRLVSEIGEDGWVRVEWDTGSRNSYRMGKNGKFDLKIVGSGAQSDDVDKDDNGYEKNAKEESQQNSIATPFTFLSKTITSLIIHSLSVMACQKKNISPLATNVVMKFLVKTFRDCADNNVPMWGADMSIAAAFGFSRALSVSEDIRRILSSDDWVTLLTQLLNLSLIKYETTTNGNSLLVKTQLIKQIEHSMMLKEKENTFRSTLWKRWFIQNIFKLLTKILSSHLLFTTEQTSNVTVKTSMTATFYTTIADEYIILVRSLHATNNWKDMINLQLCKSLSLLKIESGLNMGYLDQLKVFSTLCLIGGIDSRVRVGGTAHSGKHGVGTIANILPDGQILLYFGNSIKSKSCHLSKLDIIPGLSFNITSLMNHAIESSMHTLLKVVLQGPKVDWKLDLRHEKNHVMTIRLYVAGMRCIREICQSSYSLNQFFQSWNSQDEETLLKILNKSILSSPLQSIYEESDLELVAASISQEISSKSSQPNATKLYTKNVSSTSNATKNGTNEQETDSECLLQLLSTMGFSSYYVKYAIGQLGESARPEQVVSWLLEHPDMIIGDNENNTATADDIMNQKRSSSHHSMQSDSDEYERETIFQIGNLVQCICTTVDISIGDIGTVLKFLKEIRNVLVHWQKIDKTLWIAADRIIIVESKDDNMSSSLKVGTQVKLKSSVNVHRYDMDSNMVDEVGTLINVNDSKVTVLFPSRSKPWEGNINDLVPILKKCRCNMCKQMLHSSFQLICTQCEEFLLCEKCFSVTTNHNHEFMLHGEKGKPVLIGAPGAELPGQSSCTKESKHSCIKEILVSSNEHLAARMINKELDMSWISEQSSQPHWIGLKLQSNIVINNLSVTVDTSDVSTCPTSFIVYGGGSKKVLLNNVFVKQDQNVVRLLGEQDKVYTFIEVKIIVGDGSTSSPCKICHLDLTGARRDEDYDQQIMDLFCCQEKPDDMRSKIDQVKVKEQGFYKQKSSNKQVKVFCWGLNDKDQLGGMKGSKIKSPALSEKLSSLKCRDFVGGSKTLFCITYEGSVYACGESTCGRLGLGVASGNVSIPRMIDGLSHVTVKKVAVHSGGRHAIALTVTGEAYSWGDGDDGKLGHGNNLVYESPQKIETFIGSYVTDIACGSSHSAAIVNNRELYTWGLGDYGRLGHGDEVVQLKPKLVKGLLGFNVIDVSCGSRDAQTICLTDDGRVWSWGDGDFGKLGRGGSDGCLFPLVVESLNDVGVCKILCGAQFNLAMTDSGAVWTWGKGDFFRLGHNSVSHIREPKVVELLQDKRIVDVAVGALHCIVVTEDGEVYTWGDNDHGQQGTGTTSVNKIPTRVLGTEEHRIKHVACGSSHSVAWAEINPVSSFLNEPVAFPINRDPLGANLILPKASNETSVANIAKFMKDQRPSLIRAILQITSKSLQQEALKKILEATEIKFARFLLVRYLEFCCDQSKTSVGLDYSDRFHQKDITCMIHLLKLGLCGHLSKRDTEVLYRFLRDIRNHNTQMSDALVSVCLRELEEKIAHNLVMQEMYKPCIQESSHPYHGAPGVKLSGSVKYTGATLLVVEFDELSQTEPVHDVLTFFDSKNRTLAIRTGSMPTDWNTKLKITGEELSWCFTTNSPGGLWGFRFTVTPIPPTDEFDMDTMSDEFVLKRPCLELVKRLISCDMITRLRDETIILKLSSLLSMCIKIPSLSTEERRWMLDHLHALLLCHNAPAIDVPVILNCSRYRDPSACKLRTNGNQRMRDMVLSSTLSNFINGLPHALLKQYEFEEQCVRRGDQMTFSPFLRSLSLFACSLGLDTLPCCSNKHQWAWFGKYCNAIRAAQSFIQSSALPRGFQLDIRQKIGEILTEGESQSFEYENNNLFSRAKDEQLLMWLNRRAQDWSVIWGGNGTVYGWGHNHRGQLGGSEGAKVKTPVICDSLAALKPVQMIGGEQTLFCVTVDGKVYASGYGNSSRLGLGNVESISSPRMIESLQHITIKKVAVHSGGRHSLALSSDGEVFSWGEGDDGKLGHGNRNSCSHPKLVESFRGRLITDISAGGSHSAAIGEHGELYTWGKGRYGRLGHGDGEDHLRPKIVEVLQAFRVIDVACGSGDSQTLCVTSDDLVWSWGDGDYGKLGRGGSDGCKIPMIIDDLSDKSVFKVKCGSQFSMALTRHGALYTWGKGDYFRLGHGSEEHVRRPRHVVALEAKVITAVCCGSLHCVVCTEEGDVYCWGDNDEGQLGDGTTNAGQLPKLCTVLQNKKIDCIASGSAHTIAWSTCESIGHTLPAKIPIEYNQLQEIPIPTLRNRAFLLHFFSKLFCSCIPLMELVKDEESTVFHGDLMINSLKGLILCSFKENSFRKVIDVTMVRDRQHGPVIELNRVKNHRIDKGLAGPDGSKSVFGQITSKITEFSVESFRLPHRTWKVKFIGESVDDCGGGFSESIAEMCEELQNGSLPLLISTPNSREESSESNDYLIVNPDACSENHVEMFRFFGILLGIAIRSGSPLSLSLAEPIWKLLVGLKLSLEDLEDMDRGFVAKYAYLSSIPNQNGGGEQIGDDDVTALELPYSIRSSSSKEASLSQTETVVTSDNKQEYLKSALQYRLHEFDEQIQWIRNGMSQVVPVPLISLFTGPELENMVCGNAEIHVDALRSITTYRGIESSCSLVKWFWQVLEEFSNHERSLFLRFVWGRTRLPRTAVDFKGKDFIFQVLDKYHPADYYLPESYTCFFLLKMPRYSSVRILREKLKYAIYFCKSIDSDDYARIDLTNA